MTKLETALEQFAAILTEEVGHVVARLRAAEKEAHARIAAMAPTEEFDVPAAAKYLGISSSTLRRRVGERAIAYRRDGARLLFTHAALDEYRQRNRVLAREGAPLPG